MKKVVIISQVSYPNLSPRGHRTTELAKEYAKRGCNVVVYALLGDYNYSDFSQKTDITFKSLGKSRFGLSDNTGYRSKNIIYRFIALTIGKYTHFPNIELLSLVKKAIENEREIDCLITIAAPHIIHYAAAKSDRSLVRNWIADCGDPFMGNPFHSVPKYFEKYERYWCERCNYIMVPVKEAIEAYYLEYREKIKVIPQGFDFNALKLAEYSPNNVPTFAYSGVVYKDRRDPSLLLEHLSSLSIKFKFVVYTPSKNIFEEYKDRLGDKLEIRDRVSRDKLLLELSKMDFLLNISNESGVQQPSKLIDYALTKRPILEISSKFDNNEKDVFNDFLSKNYGRQLIFDNIERYNIVNVVNNIEELCKIK